MSFDIDVLVKKIGGVWTVRVYTDRGIDKAIVQPSITGRWVHINHKAFGYEFMVTVMNAPLINKPVAANIQFFDEKGDRCHHSEVTVVERSDESHYFIY